MKPIDVTSSSSSRHVARIHLLYRTSVPPTARPGTLAAVFITSTLPSTPAWVRSIAMSMSVYLSVRSNISKTTLPNFSRLSVHVDCGGAAMIRHVLPVLWMTSCYQQLALWNVMDIPNITSGDCTA